MRGRPRPKLTYPLNRSRLSVDCVCSRAKNVHNTPSTPAARRRTTGHTQTALQCHAAHDAACEHGRKYACGQTGPPYQEQHLPAWVHTRIHPTAKCGPFSCSAPRGSLRGETAACHGHVCSEPAAQALFVKSDHVTLSTRCIAKLAGSCAREGRGSDDNGLPHLLCAGGDRAQMTMGFPIFFAPAEIELR